MLHKIILMGALWYVFLGFESLTGTWTAVGGKSQSWLYWDATTTNSYEWITHTHTRLLKQRVALFVFGSCNLLARAQLTHIPHTEQHAHTSMIVCVRVHMHILIYLQQKFHCHTIIVPVTVRCLSTSSVTCWAVSLLLFFKTDTQWKCNVNVNSNYILFYILITNFG